MTEEQKAEMIEIMELLANELEAEIEARYEDINLLHYPSMGRRRERDMAIVKRARDVIKNELKTETSEQADDLITTGEAGEILGLSHWAVAERCRHGELHCQVIGNRYLVSRDEVLRLAGYVKLAIAAPLMGMTYKRLHRLVKAGKIEGKKINNRWHVKKPAEGQANATA